MTQQEYNSNMQELKNKIEELKLEYIESLPFKEGDFVRVKYKDKNIETRIVQVYMPIYNLSGERFNLLVEDEAENDECYVIPYIQIEDVEVLRNK